MALGEYACPICKAMPPGFTPSGPVIAEEVAPVEMQTYEYQVLYLLREIREVLYELRDRPAVVNNYGPVAEPTGGGLGDILLRARQFGPVLIDRNECAKEGCCE